MSAKGKAKKREMEKLVPRWPDIQVPARVMALDKVFVEGDEISFSGNSVPPDVAGVQYITGHVNADGSCTLKPKNQQMVRVAFFYGKSA